MENENLSAERDAAVRLVKSLGAKYGDCMSCRAKCRFSGTRNVNGACGAYKWYWKEASDG